MTQRTLITLVGAAIVIFGIVLLFRPDQAPTPQEETNTPPLESPRGDQWFGKATTTQGLTFMYPDPFPGKYVTALKWPPLVEMTVNRYSCVEGPITAADGPLKTAKTVSIGGREYCRTTSVEGAAGSTYTNYEYATDMGGSALRIVFTLRRVQCQNYDELERGQCIAEQESFDTDMFADRMARSIEAQ